jgi:transposase
LPDLALPIGRTAQPHAANPFYRLRSIPGAGKILALVMLDALHAIPRFPSVQDFVSYCRLVKCAKESAGTRYGTSGKKIGNADLKWAFSEAAVLLLRHHAAGQKYLARLEKKQGTGQALTMRAHTLARAVYHMLKRAVAFDMTTFMHGSRRGVGEPSASLDNEGISLSSTLGTLSCVRLCTRSSA